MYVFLLLSCALASLVLTYAALYVLPRFGFMDRQEPHSTHRDPRPRGGGIVVFLVFATAVLLVLPHERPLLGMLAGAALILAVNFIDDKTNRVPWWGRLLAEVVGALVVVYAGVHVDSLINPFTGNAIFFTPLMNAAFMVVWVVVSINAMNWLDGVDGLATGVSAIAAATLFGLALLPYVNQPTLATMAIALVGALLGFLVLNFFPAKIKLGDAGSTVLGFLLAVMAVFSSGKVATFFLVLGLPLLDVLWVIARRVFVERRSPFAGDRKHFHHRLLALGLPVPTVVLVFYLFSAAYGFIALQIQGAQKKLLAIAIMTATMIVLGTFVVLRNRGRMGNGHNTDSTPSS